MMNPENLNLNSTTFKTRRFRTFRPWNILNLKPEPWNFKPWNLKSWFLWILKHLNPGTLIIRNLKTKTLKLKNPETWQSWNLEMFNIWFLENLKRLNPETLIPKNLKNRYLET
jgi:hypothetical protein